MLQSLLNDGISYAFISNSDNLGARLDESLLGYFAHHQFPFMMEVEEKTPADIKGGHLARHKSSRLILKKAAKCTEDESLRINPIRIKNNKPETTKVKLDPRYYGKIDDLDQRFSARVPSLVECDALTIEGDVRFEKNGPLRAR